MPPRSDRQLCESAPTAAPPSVLLVDDELVVRTAMRRYFTRRGWAVCEAGDGESARCLLQPAAGHRFALVICDLHMPGLAGDALYAWLRSVRPDAAARFVIASGDRVSTEALRGTQGTGCPVLRKPFELSDLEHLVQLVGGAAGEA